MKTYKAHKTPNRNKMHTTLKNRINRQIFKKGDICCEKDIDRVQAINQIINLYKPEHNPTSTRYLDYINNDLLKFIGYRNFLNKEGVNVWDNMNKYMYKTNVIGINGTLSIDKITSLLKQVPLYYLLSFLGYAYYKKNYKFNSFPNGPENGPVMKRIMAQKLE